MYGQPQGPPGFMPPQQNFGPPPMYGGPPQGPPQGGQQGPISDIELSGEPNTICPQIIGRVQTGGTIRGDQVVTLIKRCKQMEQQRYVLGYIFPGVSTFNVNDAKAIIENIDQSLRGVACGYMAPAMKSNKFSEADRYSCASACVFANDIATAKSYLGLS